MFVITVINYVIMFHLGPKISQYFVRYKREFVITLIVLTEFDCMLMSKFWLHWYIVYWFEGSQAVHRDLWYAKFLLSKEICLLFRTNEISAYAAKKPDPRFRLPDINIVQVMCQCIHYIQHFRSNHKDSL